MKTFLLSFILLVSISTYGQNNAMHLDGINDFLTKAYFPLQGDFTVSYWCKPESNTSSFDDRIVAWGPLRRLEVGVADRNCPSNKLWIYNAAGGGVQCNSGPILRDGNWHHIAVVRQNNNMKIYIDGSQIYSFGTSSTYEYGPHLRVGTWTGTPALPTFYHGILDELRVWSYARTLTEIESDMHYELTGDEVGLTSYYNFNQGIGGGDNATIVEVIDAKGVNNLTIFNLAKNGPTSNFVGSTAPIISDTDDDGISDVDDNCPTVYNPDQEDKDFDGDGDACDEEVNIDLISDVILDEIESLNVPGGNGLIGKINSFLSSCGQVSAATSINKLEAFINQVEAKIGNGLTEEEGNYLIALAETIITALDNGDFNCGSELNTRSRTTYEEIQVFPNPGHDFIQLKGVRITEDQIAVYNAVGRTFLQPVYGNTIDIMDLPSGMYHLTYRNKTKSFIKI